MRSLSGQELRRAREAVATLGFLHLKNQYSEETACEKLGFGSVEAMHQQLSSWGVPSWLITEDSQDRKKRRRARSGGKVQPIPPIHNARDIFTDVIERLARFVEGLPLRREHRQGERIVVSDAKPFLGPSEPGENYGYLEPPPDAQPNEHGVISYTLDKAYRRVPGGAARHPDQESTAMIAAALLVGVSPDKLLEALHPEPTDDVRNRVRLLLEGNNRSTRRDSLKNKAQQVATLIRGGAVGKGLHNLVVSKEEQASAWRIQ